MKRLLLNLLLQSLRQHGDNLVQVSNDAEVGDAEDGGKLVLVDGDDEVGLFHTGQVLDGTADTASHVEVRADSLTRLTDLTLVRHHAVVDHGTARRNLSAKHIGQSLQLVEAFLVVGPRSWHQRCRPWPCLP